MAFNMQRSQIPERMKYQGRYNAARANVLLVAVLSLINVILLAVNADIYFPFSASFPYYLISGARLLCGMYPEEFYVELAELTGEPVMTEFLPPVIFTVVLVIGVLLIAIFSLCWLLSKKRVGWMIAALVLFVLDTLYLLSMGISIDMIIDIIFHAWVLYSVISGTIAFFKLKSLPDDEHIVLAVDEEPAHDGATDEKEEKEEKEESSEDNEQQ
jgi:hypothetical protein